MILVGLSVADESQAAVKKHTDIPAESLGVALQTLAKDRNFQIVYVSEEINALQTQGLVGEFTSDEALKRLLNGTGLTFHYLDANTVTVEPIMAPQPPGDAENAPAKATSENQSAKAKPTAFGEDSETGFWKRSHMARVDQGTPSNYSSVAPNSDRVSQQGSEQLEEIVVTAQKRVERLIDTPQSVSVVTAGDLSKLGATQFSDFANTIPGLDFTTAGPGATQITLRGLTTGFDIGSTIGVYVDDVPFGTSGAFAQGAQNTIDVGLFDLDRIEVLRGPQGTLYGASTMGGLIKYVTKQPNTTMFEGDAQAGVSGTADGGGVNYNAAAAVNIPIAPGMAGLRASGYESHEGGYIDNVALGQKNVNRSDVYGGRLDFLLTPTEALSIRIDTFLQDISRDGQSTADYTLAGAPVYGDLDQFRKVAEPWKQQFRLVSATIDYDLGPATLTSISSYQTVRTQYVFDVSSLYVPFFPTLYSAIGYPVDTGTNKVTQEFRLASKEGQTLEWLIGGYYTHESTTNVEKLQPYTLTGLPSSANLFSFSNPSTYAEYSAFGDLTWHITTRFDVTGGLRYSHDTQAKTQIGSGLFGSSEPETSSDESVVTYLANARYHFSDNEVGYLRFATGYRPGGPNFVSLNPITHVPNGPPVFESDHLDSYEAGFKAETNDRRFSADLAAYYINWSNIQVSVSTGNGFSGIGNAPGGATVKGAELTLTANPSRGFVMTGAFAYQHAYLKQADASLGASEGEDLPNVPRFSGTLNADYTFTENALQPTIGGTARHVDARWSSFTNSVEFPQYHLPEYTTVDFRMGLTFGPVVTQLYVHNAFDEQGQLGVLFPQFGNHIAIVQPRTVGITATTHF